MEEIFPLTNQAGEPLNAEGLTEVECSVLGLPFEQGTTADKVAVIEVVAEVDEPKDVLAPVAPAVVIPASVGGNEPWSGLPEVGLNQSGERSPNWEDPLSLPELQAATNETYAVAIERLVYAVEAIEHAGALHARTKHKIRTMLRAGEPVTFIADLPPSIGRRVDADSSGKLGADLRRLSAAMNGW